MAKDTEKYEITEIRFTPKPLDQVLIEGFNKEQVELLDPGISVHFQVLRGAVINYLIDLGRGAYVPATEGLSRGQCFGLALTPYFTRNEILDIAAEALEDNNHHSDAKKIRNIKEGK